MAFFPKNLGAKNLGAIVKGAALSCLFGALDTVKTPTVFAQKGPNDPDFNIEFYGEPDCAVASLLPEKSTYQSKFTNLKQSAWDMKMLGECQPVPMRKGQDQKLYYSVLKCDIYTMAYTVEFSSDEQCKTWNWQDNGTISSIEYPNPELPKEGDNNENPREQCNHLKVEEGKTELNHMRFKVKCYNPNWMPPYEWQMDIDVRFMMFGWTVGSFFVMFWYIGVPAVFWVIGTVWNILRALLCPKDDVHVMDD